MTSSHSKTKTGRKLAGIMGTREHKGENRLPCPFYKHDVQAHQTMRSCSGKGSKDVAHLQEHLRDYHSSSKSQSQIGFMTDVQNEEIKALNRTFKGDPKGRWRAIYKILFPQEAVPDPFSSLALAQQLEHAARDPDATLIQTFKSKLGQSFSRLDGQFSKDTFIAHFCAAYPAFVEAVQQRYGYGGIEARSGEITLASLSEVHPPPVDPLTSGSEAVPSPSIEPFVLCLPPMDCNSQESPAAYSANLDHDGAAYGANEVPYCASDYNTGSMAFVGDGSVFFEDSIADSLD